MDLKHLVAFVAAESGIGKEAASRALLALAAAVTGELRSGWTQRVPGLGTFSVQERPAMDGHNPRTGEPIRIAAKRVAKFRPAAQLREALNPPAARRMVGGGRQ